MSNPENNKEKEAKVCDNKSVGMLVYKGNKILLIERKQFPLGFAPPAGHVEKGYSFKDTAIKEVKEEVGLTPRNLKFLIEGRKDNNVCKRGSTWHYWKIYEVEVEGTLKPSKVETKQAGWYSKQQIDELAKRTKEYLSGKILEEEWQTSPGIEPVWAEWFKELRIIEQ